MCILKLPSIGSFALAFSLVGRFLCTFLYHESNSPTRWLVSYYLLFNYDMSNNLFQLNLLPPFPLLLFPLCPTCATLCLNSYCC